MLRIAACSLLLTMTSQSVLAEQVFQCGEATVTMSVDTTLPLRSTDGADVILRVERGPRSTLLRYSNGGAAAAGGYGADLLHPPLVVGPQIEGVEMHPDMDASLLKAGKPA
ncbi:hypothetical protein D9M71_753290 [compost metagenome]